MIGRSKMELWGSEFKKGEKVYHWKFGEVTAYKADEWFQPNYSIITSDMKYIRCNDWELAWNPWPEFNKCKKGTEPDTAFRDAQESMRKTNLIYHPIFGKMADDSEIMCKRVELLPAQIHGSDVKVGDFVYHSYFGKCKILKIEHKSGLPYFHYGFWYVRAGIDPEYDYQLDLGWFLVDVVHPDWGRTIFCDSLSWNPFPVFDRSKPAVVSA